MPLQITQPLGAGAGIAVDLGGNHVYVEVEAGGDCWVRATESTESAPSATPATTAPTPNTWIHLSTAGDKAIFDLTQASTRLAPGRKITQILIWSIAAGDHTITGPGV